MLPPEDDGYDEVSGVTGVLEEHDTEPCPPPVHRSGEYQVGYLTEIARAAGIELYDEDVSLEP